MRIEDEINYCLFFSFIILALNVQIKKIYENKHTSTQAHKHKSILLLLSLCTFMCITLQSKAQYFLKVNSPDGQAITKLIKE